MDDKTIGTVVTGLLQLPAYAFLLWLWLEQIKAHKEVVEYYRKQVEKLQQELIACFGEDTDKKEVI